jgi:hypothetical protein
MRYLEETIHGQDENQKKKTNKFSFSKWNQLQKKKL